MLFNSLTYIVFLTAVVTVYYILPHKWRWLLLLAASYLFYMAWRPGLIVLLLFSTFSDYFIGLLIGGTDRQKTKKRLLILSFTVNLGLLFVFKYLVFVNHSFMYLFESIKARYPVPDFDLILPLGISFYTFQTMSYIFDIYKGKQKPERNFLRFALFISFFPQLVAGPIERTDRLLPQFSKNVKFDINNIVLGSKYIVWGLMKKIVIADRAAAFVNTVYNSPHYYGGLSLFLATLFFAVQIYCDFSGYSDMAVGSAKCLGIDLMQNFRQPYIARNLADFWNRWHISLSSWFRDYLYIPLGGSRVSKPRHYLNLFTVFLLSGIWHGANWTFMLWGAVHGFFRVAGQFKDDILYKNKKKKDYILLVPFRVIFTFALVCFAWIFFRANSISDAVYIMGGIFSGIGGWLNPQYLYNAVSSLGPIYEITAVSCVIAFLFVTDIMAGKRHVCEIMDRRAFPARLLFYGVVCVIIMNLGVFGNANEFVYFQF